MVLIVGMLGGYLLASVSCAILVCALLGLPNPQTKGSGNPGATNVLRLGGRWPAMLTLLGDALKGWLPIFLVKLFTLTPWVISLVLLATIAGHLYPLYFHFKGGKGVATALGAILALSPLLGAIFILTWLIVFMLCRYASLSSLLAMASLPIWTWLIDSAYTGLICVVALLITWRHHENIKRLLCAKEKKLV